MKTKNEFQGNNGIKALQAKNFTSVIGFKTLQNEELIQINGGYEIPISGEDVEENDID